MTSKALFVLVVPVLVFGGRAPVAVVRPLGPVAVPSGRPLGGAPLPTAPTVRRRVPRGTTGFGYATPIYYIPNAYDSSSYTDPSGYPPPAPPASANQYFGSRGSSVPDAVNTADSQPVQLADSDEPKPGDLLAPAENYYLIRYKDRSTFSALTYWLEGDTLHYVTTQNTHNQASLSLIDIDATYRLNADRSVPFTVPGH